MAYTIEFYTIVARLWKYMVIKRLVRERRSDKTTGSGDVEAAPKIECFRCGGPHRVQECSSPTRKVSFRKAIGRGSTKVLWGRLGLFGTAGRLYQTSAARMPVVRCLLDKQ